MMNQQTHDIPLAVVGCDFRVASSRWRSLLVLDDDEALTMSAQLASGGWAEGIADLNTCNRNEWIVSSADPAWAAELLKARMLERLGSEGRDGIEPYSLVGDEAARHLFRVAVGQESLVVGERQIATQVFRALENARARGSSSRPINGLGSIAGRLVRIAIRRGCVSSTSSGVHSLALSYVRHWLAGRRQATVAVVGLGSIGRRVLGFLEQDPAVRTVACNRTVTADSHSRVVPLTELGSALGECDAAVVCTGARRPVFHPAQLAERHSDRPLLVVDIGIPEQVDRHGLPAGVEVVGLDQLTDYMEASRTTPVGDGHGAANELVERAVDELRRFCNEPTFSEVLESVQSRHRRIATETVPRLTRGRFDYLRDEDRTQLESELRALLSEYTSDLFHSIREAAGRKVSERAWTE